VIEFRSFGDSTSHRVEDKLRTIRLKRVTQVNVRVNERSSNSAGSSLINSILRIRLRSSILWKHDLETTEICCANDRFVSKMIPSLRAESTGKIMTLLGR